MNNKDREEFLIGYNRVQKEVHDVAKDHGWWDEPVKTPLECVCLMHSELSEAAEAIRDSNIEHGKFQRHIMCEKDGLKHITNLEEELADVVIRIMDFCGWNYFNLATTILAKMEYNKSRPYKHGRNL